MYKNFFAIFSFLLITNNVLFNVPNFNRLATPVFLSIISLFLFVIIFSPRTFKKLILHKGFYVFFAINLLNIVYFILFDINSLESFKYLSARFFKFLMFSYTIYHFYENFQEIFLKYINGITVFVLIVSLVFSFPTSFENRYYGMLNNPNELSIIFVLGFAYQFIVNQLNYKSLILMILFFFLIFLSGSRSALLAVPLAFIVKNSFTKRNIASLFILAIAAFIILPFFGNENALARIVSTSDDIFFNRRLETYYAFKTFLNEFWFGNGLLNYSFIEKSLINIEHQRLPIGIHNGYLAILVQYGFLFGLVFYYIFISTIYKIYTYFNQQNKLTPSDKFLIFIIIYSLFNCLVENLFSGINFFLSNVFWITIGYISFDIYQKKISE